MSGGALREQAAVASVLAAMASVVLDAGLVSLALPTIGRALAAPPSRALLLVGAYQLALLIGLLPCAHLADRLGARRLFAGGILLFAGASILAALAPTLPLLVGARFLQGLGGAAVMALGIALLRDALGPERLGGAIAWNAMVVAICSAAAPAAGALLLSFAGWRWLFLVPLPMTAIALAAAPALPARKPGGRSVDPASIALYAATAACAVVAAEMARTSSLIALAVAGASLFCAFGLAIRERRSTRPLVPLDLLALRPFRAAVTASAFLFTAQSAGILALSFHLQLTLGRGAASAGLVLAAWPVAVAATSRVADRLAARVHPGSLCAAGSMLLAAGLAASAGWPVGGPIAPLAASTFLCGIGFGLFQVPNNRTLFLDAPADRSAAAGGLQGTARLAGQTLGALLTASILSAAPMSHAPRLALGSAAAAALAAACISVRRKATAHALPQAAGAV